MAKLGRIGTGSARHGKGLELGAETNLPEWDGNAVDYDWAVGAMVWRGLTRFMSLTMAPGHKLSRKAGSRPPCRRLHKG
jgi:hypothetical protein